MSGQTLERQTDADRDRERGGEYVSNLVFYAQSTILGGGGGGGE